jgi:hypothetical protein
MNDCIFPLDNVEAFIRNNKVYIERTEFGLKWNSGPGVVEINIQPLNLKLNDGRVVAEQVILSYSSPTIAQFDSEYVSELQKFTLLSTFIPSTSASKGILVSKVGIFDTDKVAAEKIYAPLIAQEASIIAWHCKTLVNGISSFNSDLSPLTSTDKLPPYSQSEYEVLKELLESLGHFTSIDEYGITTEFPWDLGAVSRSFKDGLTKKELLKAGYDSEFVELAGGNTALFELRVSNHPMYGSGILSLLKLPLNLEDNDAVNLSNRLNYWELMSPELPPLFGSWSPSKGTVVFVSFIPTQFCISVPGFIHNITMWAKIRALNVRAVLKDSEVLH